MLKLREIELMALFRQPGGAEFVAFCNEVIRATCWSHGLAQSEVSTTTRTDVADGGVDTRVNSAIPTDKSGYFHSKTAWQFKAADQANVTAADISKEVNKPHARSCIISGHAYRICICAHVTDEKRHSLEQALVSAVAAINTSAPAPKILGIADICATANSFPALVMGYRPGLDSICVLFDRWGQSIASVTPRFTPRENFEPIKAALLNHADFAKQPDDVVLSLSGQSGVGKTRTVYESLREQPGASSMVLYSDDEEHMSRLANMFLNDGAAHVVLVADECSLATRVKLSRALSGSKSRIRCICIDNSAERPGTLAPELKVAMPSYLELNQILANNFPQIPPDRIRAYAELSEGFIKIAADMCCYYDEKIAQAGNIGPIARKLEEYYRERLGSDERMRAVEAMALLKRVKRKGESPTELDQICLITGWNRKELDEELANIKDAPGFIERGPLYYRVAPELIAIIAFEGAWRRWAEKEPEEFLRSIPEAIQESFLERVSEGRDGGVRKTVQGFFRKFADSFRPRDLADLRLVNRFIRLIETDPETYLPVLRRAVESAEHEDLVSPRREEWRGSWGPRRQLVWLTERFVQFPEFFGECEKILFVLATHECENNIGNNASQIWQQLFKMHLSGTSLPLETRLHVLKNRLQSATQESAVLLAGAVGAILEFNGSRLLGPPVVAGRLVPPEWKPIPQEYTRDLFDALHFIEETSRHALEPLAKLTKTIFLSNIELLARQGWIGQLRTLVADSQLNEDERARLVSKLKQFLSWSEGPHGQKLSEEYSRKLRGWVTELEPHSLHSRLVETVGSQSWDYFGRENEWELSLRTLAVELTGNPDAFKGELGWLTSPEALSAFHFGHAIGKINRQANLIDEILEKSACRERDFARGYVAGLMSEDGVYPSTVISRLDTWEIKNPLYAFQLALAAGEKINVFDRTICLIKNGKIPVYHLRNFTHWVGRTEVSDQQVVTALKLLLPHVEAGEDFCADVLMSFIGARLHSGKLKSILKDEPELFWSAIAAFAEHPGPQESFWWAKSLAFAVPVNPTLSIRLACKALVGENYAMSEDAKAVLSQLSSTHPNEVMSELGSVMLDEKVGLRFFLSKFSIFSVLPFKVVTDWLAKAGPAGAQKIARHLLPPAVDSQGKLLVPELTEWVLSQFENDDRVFAEFCAGVHSFQMYTGDAASVHDSEASTAQLFYSHPLRRIREWARIEYDSARQNAQMQREWDDQAAR